MLRLITAFLFLAATSGLMAAVVDNFNSYSIGHESDAFATTSGGTPNTDTTGIWNEWYKWKGDVEVETSTVEINTVSGDQLLRFGWVNNKRGAYRDLGNSYQIDDDATGSFEFSFFVKSHVSNNSNNANNDLYYGIGHESSPADGIDSFVAGINLQHDEDSSKLKLRAFNGDSMTTSSVTYNYDTWYNVALSIDRTTDDTYSVYVNDSAILTDQSFNTDSNIGNDSLSTFMVLADNISSNEHAYLDNVGYSTSLVPEVDNFSLLISLGLLTACITKRKLSVRP